MNSYRNYKRRMGRCFWLAIILLATVLTNSASGKTDSEVFALIDSVRQKAAQIQRDGNGTDWEGIPLFSAPTGDAGGDDSRDIVGVAIAPRENDLLLLVATAGTPSTEDVAFWLNIDFLGSRSFDIQLGLRSQGTSHVLWIFQQDKAPVSNTIEGVEVSIAGIVEIRIPYAALAAKLPPEMAQLLTGASARPWMRVSPFTYNGTSGTGVDMGYVVASYRLLPTPYSLDPPPPQPGTPVSVGLPFNGKWLVGQGAFTQGTHKGVWAYDLVVVDSTLQASSVPGSTSNADYYAWGEQVLAPVSARVLNVTNNAPDIPPGPLPNNPSPGNQVLMELSDTVALRYVHFQQNSVAVLPNDVLAPGDFLGLVGNSGNSSQPHVHMNFLRRPDLARTLPMAFADVTVGLNPGAVDPWSRDVASWEPSEGFFVERITPLQPPPLPLTINSATIPEAEVNVPYHASFHITGGIAPYTITLLKGSLPVGLNLTGDDIVGNPVAAQAASFTVKVSDQNGSTATKSFKIKVLRPLVISTTSFKVAITGKSYRSSLKAKGGKKPYVWSLVAGNLPNGLTFDSAMGRIAGTPTMAGAASLTFQVTDPLGSVVEKALVLTVN